MSQIALDLIHDRKIAILMIEGARPLVAMAAHQLEGLILALGEIRADMAPAVERGSPIGKSVKALRQVAIASETDGLRAMNIIHLRDPRFGWLHYAFTPEEARALIASLEEALRKIDVSFGDKAN